MQLEGYCVVVPEIDLRVAKPGTYRSKTPNLGAANY